MKRRSLEKVSWLHKFLGVNTKACMPEYQKKMEIAKVHSCKRYKTVNCKILQDSFIRQRWNKKFLFISLGNINNSKSLLEKKLAWSVFSIWKSLSVIESLHQDRGPYYLHLPIFSLYTLLLLENKKLLWVLFSSAN